MLLVYKKYIKRLLFAELRGTELSPNPLSLKTLVKIPSKTCISEPHSHHHPLSIFAEWPESDPDLFGVNSYLRLFQTLT